MRSIPRVAVWTPLAPQRSGIAENAAALLPELGRLADVTVVVEDWLVGVAETPDRTELIGHAEFDQRRETFDMCVYHMGNHFALHGWMYDELITTPGVVVLHDVGLGGFYSQASPDLPGSSATVRERAALPGVDLTSSRFVVEASRTTLVHSPWAARSLRRACPATKIVSTHLAAPAPDLAADPAAVRRACGWDSEHFVVGVLGGFGAHKRPDLAVRAFAALHRALPVSRLLLGGWAHDSPTVALVEQLVDELGLGPVVRIATDIDSVELDGCLLASDVIVDLRSDAAGEIPATLMRAFAAGRPAVTSDLPQLKHIDDAFCHRVPLPAARSISATALALLQLGRDRLTTRALGQAAQAWIQATATPARVAAEHRAAIDLARAIRPMRSSAPVRVSDGRSLAVTVVGDLTATTGLMEAGRRLTSTLEAAGVTLEQHHQPCYGASHNPERDSDDLHRRLPTGRNHPVELWLANLNEFVAIPEDVLRPPGLHHRVIASWFWELPTAFEPFRSQVARADEIWAGSPFVRDTLQMYTSAPVVVVPIPVRVEVPDGIERRDFGLSDGDVIFFYDLDANSTAARKNPFGLIAAFARAFAQRTGGRPAPRLVLKGANLHAHDSLRHALQQALRPIDGVLIDAELSRPEMNGLLALCDVYVSLPRAEGFGLGKAEAMYLGKPVVASVYPEVWSFPASAAVCPVRARLVPIKEADHSYFPLGAQVYRPGLIWAEPDVEHAAMWLARLFDDPALRARVGAAGARMIREHHSPEAARDVMLERLRAGSGPPLDERVDDGAVPDRLAPAR